MVVSSSKLLLYFPELSISGLLCVTCTDLPVLGTTNYPEKWYASQCRSLPILILAYQLLQLWWSVC